MFLTAFRIIFLWIVNEDKFSHHNQLIGSKFKFSENVVVDCNGFSEDLQLSK